ncbi:MULTISPECIES: MarR family winged helix-turn-helix transcriptional regulator [Helcococcus]|uniref:MarR family winged helix-turn-helix transcriptional regulator n=1 Tax=Helcococcus bovis TaxID=3153252 RepID=A0ABW9F5R2_9FIRM
MEKIMRYINRIYRSSISDRTKYFHNYGLTGHHISYLIAIYHNPGLIQEKLTDGIFVNKSTVTRNIKHLVDMELVVARVDTNDKRANRLYPTEKLYELFPLIEEYSNQWNDLIMQDLSDEEKIKFLELLRKISDRAVEKGK